MDPDSDAPESLRSSTPDDQTRESVISAASESEDAPSPPTRRVRIEVVIPAHAPSAFDEYVDLQSKVVERVVEEVSAPEGGDLWYQVEFRDGRHNIVSDRILRLILYVLSWILASNR